MFLSVSVSPIVIVQGWGWVELEPARPNQTLIVSPHNTLYSSQLALLDTSITCTLSVRLSSSLLLLTKELLRHLKVGYYFS